MSVKQGGNTIAGASTTDTANKNLSNLNPQGQNIANWSTNVANCITEIPQDIKLELNNGTLTLKAGSKVYVPNGVGKFDEVVINTNRNLTLVWGTPNDKMLLFLDVATGNLERLNVSRIVSGATDTYTGSIAHIWYNTTTNKVNWINNDGSLGRQLSLPIAKFTALGDNTATVTSIDQVFNGFGYIGSTVFALPGVKGLAPDGRNSDGTLKNIKFTVSQVVTQTTTTTFTDMPFVANSNAIQWINYLGEFTTPPAVQQYKAYFNPIENKLYFASTADTWTQLGRAFCGRVSSNGKITSFTPKTVFHAVDRNDSSWIAQQAMPSTRYIDLTLGASGSTYTAPANGWYSISKRASAVNQYVEMDCNSLGSRCYSPYGDTLMAVYVPASKGSTMKIYYNAGGATSYFRFIYAEGEN